MPPMPSGPGKKIEKESQEDGGDLIYVSGEKIDYDNPFKEDEGNKKGAVDYSMPRGMYLKKLVDEFLDHPDNAPFDISRETAEKAVLAKKARENKEKTKQIMKPGSN